MLLILFEHIIFYLHHDFEAHLLKLLLDLVVLLLKLCDILVFHFDLYLCSIQVFLKLVNLSLKFSFFKQLFV